MNLPRKALVLVDDEKAYIDILAQLLTEHLGCPVLVFYRPSEALAALANLDVGCVVTDFHMPEMNGYDLIAKASAQLPGVPFLMISGHAVHLRDDETLWPAAMRSLLAKPFGWRALAGEIAKHAPDFAATFTRFEPDSTPVK